MRRHTRWTGLGIIALLTTACSGSPTPLTDAQKSAISDSVKTALNIVLKSSEQKDWASAFKPYATDADARFVENGFLYPSNAEYKAAFNAMAPDIDSVENRVDAWDIMVLANDAAAFTVPAHFTIKVKDRPSYSGQWVWSGVVQRRAGAWVIVQSHESWLNAAEAMAALMPAKPGTAPVIQRPLPKKP